MDSILAKIWPFIFLQILQNYGVQSKIFCRTTDNSSNNGTLSRALQNMSEEYSAAQNLLGCVGHVGNLARKAGLKITGHYNNFVNRYGKS
jgi:hypothetical protein